MIQQWEYLVTYIFKDTQGRLNKLGLQGWELVKGPTYANSEYIFKRPKPTTYKP